MLLYLERLLKNTQNVLLSRKLEITTESTMVTHFQKPSFSDTNCLFECGSKCLYH